MSPEAQPIPTLPQPVMQGDIKGRKPKLQSATPTFLGDSAVANTPAAGGKTFLGS